MAHKEGIRSAAKAALLAGQSVGEVAEEYRLPLSTVSRWGRIVREEFSDSEEVSALLLEFLAVALETTIEQQIFFRDVDWMRGQKASDLAILHGVTTDKVVRLLEAMSPPQGRQE